jgi:hypothetical protein
VTFLSRLAKLGVAKEAVPYTYLAPTFSVPFTTAKFVNLIAPNRDESIRANDAMLQGIVQGTAYSTWDIMSNSYADLVGIWLRSIIGPDTVAAGTSTTLAANCAAGATTLTLTATMPSGTIQISDASGANLEWVTVTVASTTATVTSPTTGTKFAHTAIGGAVIGQSTHVFKQNRSFATVWPTYSLTTDTGQDQLGWAGCVCSELALKIDPKGLVTWGPKFTGFPQSTQSTFAYAASNAQPMQGWAWTCTNGGGASTRGLTMDVTLKRATEPIFSSDGLQSPREVFPGALEVDGQYKAVYDSAVDMNLYLNYTQTPTVHTLTQPLATGGAVIAITMSQSGYTTGEVDLGSAYIQATYALSGINNTTDAGVASVSLKNYQAASY